MPRQLAVKKMAGAYRIVAGCLGLMIICATPACALTCLQAANKLQTLQNELYSKFACKLPPKGPMHILSAGSSPTDTENSTPCMVSAANAAALKAWMAQNEPVMDALRAQLATCATKACPKLFNPAWFATTLIGSAAANTPPSDVDRDGIPDAVEAKLIARYSPFLRFTLSDESVSEAYPPTDPLWYLQRSELGSRLIKSTIR